ncbi:MAG: hypothetical protein ACETV0_06400 [Nitrososphaeria archaeon]
MWLEAVLLLAAFFTGIILILVQDYFLTRRKKRKDTKIPDDRVIEAARSSDQVFRRIEEAVSKKGKLTVDELSEIILSEGSSLDLHRENLRARLREMDMKIAAVLEETNKRGQPNGKTGSSPN